MHWKAIRKIKSASKNEFIITKLKRIYKDKKISDEKGCGAWLTALPLTSMGYVFNKQEFRDSIKLRYGWKIADIPSYCVCGEKNDIDHTLICKTGGHVIFWPIRICDVNANFLQQVCHNIVVEPELLPLESYGKINKINYIHCQQ